MNAYFCSISLHLECHGSKYPENIAGTIYYQNNKTEEILSPNTICMNRGTCTCYNQINVRYNGQTIAKSKYLPFKKICARKLKANGGNPEVTFGSQRYSCRAFKNYLLSSDRILTDANLQTCTVNIDLRRIIINNPIKSSMEVNVFIKKLNREEINCNSTEIYYKDKDGCNGDSYKKCSLIDSYNYISIAIKVCQYFCQFANIKEILLLRNSNHSSPNIEICEISTYLLDTSYVENNNDF